MKGGAWTAIGAATGIANNFAIISFVAIIFGPSDVGFYSLFLFFSGLGIAIFPLGINYRFVNESRINRGDYYNSILLITVALIVALTVFLITSSFFYLERSLYLPIVAGLICGCFEACGLISTSILQRGLDYKRIELANAAKNSFILAATLPSMYLSNSLYFAYLFKGVGLICFVLYTSIFAIKALEKGRVLRWPVNGTALYAAGTNLVGYISGNSEAILVLPQVGIVNFGVYNLAKKLVSQPRDLIGTITFKTIFPVYSKILRGGNDYRKYPLILGVYSDAIKAVATYGLPVISLIIISSGSVINEFFDDGWADAHIIINIFAITAFFHLFGSHILTAILTSMNQAKVIFKVELYLIPFRLAMVYVASYFDITYVALAVNCVLLVKIFALNAVLNKIMGFHLLTVWRVLLWPTLNTLASSAVAYAILLNDDSIHGVFTSLIAFIVFYTLIICLGWVYQYVFKSTDRC